MQSLQYQLHYQENASTTSRSPIRSPIRNDPTTLPPAAGNLHLVSTQGTPDAIISEEGREAYNSLIERKHNMDIDTVCLLRKQETQYSLKSAKTLPRRLSQLKTDSEEFISAATINLAESDQDLVIPPLQNAPRPTTLPTRGAANRLRKAELGMLKDESGLDAINNGALGSRMSDNISPCESPSYVTTTTCYKFPNHSQTEEENTSSLPVLPPKEGKKHIQTNPKRHVRKYPLIIPANGVQRTLNRVMADDDKSGLLKTNTTILQNTHNFSTVKPFSIYNNTNRVAEYENTNTLLKSCSSKPEDDRTYQNVSTDDTASLQFESILEADSNKDQVLQSPDVTDGFYNFSIQKDHYHKSKEVDFDVQKLASGLYVNEDELRNLDMDKNKSKQSKQSVENKKSSESLETKTSLPGEESKELAKPMGITDDSFDHSPPPVEIPNPEILMKTSIKPSKADNELAGNALFKKVRESVDKAMVKPTDDTEAAAKQDFSKNLTEAEMFSAAVNRLNDCNSVSCEDLLEFSDKKPKGPERGVDSDEVRIMMKVLGKDSFPERCLKSLEFIDWDVHKAIKIIKLQNILTDLNLTLPATVEYLLKYDWDLHTTARRLKNLKT